MANWALVALKNTNLTATDDTFSKQETKLVENQNTRILEQDPPIQILEDSKDNLEDSKYSFEKDQDLCEDDYKAGEDYKPESKIESKGGSTLRENIQENAVIHEEQPSIHVE